LYAQAVLIDRYIRPHRGNQLPLADNLAGPVDQNDQNIKSATPDCNWFTGPFEKAPLHV
jgi:hypothetical protein